MSPKQRPQVVIIDDDRSHSAVLADQLTQTGFNAHLFHKGTTALKFLQENHVHLVILDPILPDQDGLEILERARKINPATGVIFLSNRAEAPDIVQALEAGADDFIPKPYNPEILVARLRATLRRTETAYDHRLTKNADLNTKVFLFNGAEVHPERLEIVFGPNKSIKVGRKELGIIYHLHTNPGVIISRQSLIHAVWGKHANVRSRSVDQYMAKIRESFGKFGQGLNALRTIHGIGYWFEPETNHPDPRTRRRT
jgi:DNA-binding response OmpR family regulator